MSRKSARETAMKQLYQMELNKEFDENSLFIDEEAADEADNEFIEKIVKGVSDHLEEIDSKIEQHSKGWKVSRLPKVDLSILRLAIYEIDYIEDIPIQVSVNEALEIAKKYSTGDSGKFINGLLGAYLKTDDKLKKQ